MRILNLLGSPGTGKSSSAAAVFYICKSSFMKVELCTEYAKQLTYDERQNTLSNQLYVFAKQHSRLEMLKKHNLEWAISDSPLLLSLIYTPENYFPSFRGLVKDVFNSYDNLNVLLKRVKPYAAYGRNQTEEESDKIAVQIKKLLDEEKVPYVEMNADSQAPKAIYNLMTGKEVTDPAIAIISNIVGNLT